MKERERLLSDLTEARRVLQGTAASTEERRLLVQQLQTLERQEATLERAEAALRLARLKQELAHHGLEQLRMEMVIASSHDGELDRLLSTLEDSALQLQSEEELQQSS